MNTVLYHFFDILSYLGHPIVVILTILLIFFTKVFEEVNNATYLPNWDTTIKATIMYLMIVMVFIPHVIKEHFYTSVLRENIIEVLSELPPNTKIYVRKYVKKSQFKLASNPNEIIATLKKIKFEHQYGGGANLKPHKTYDFIVKIDTGKKVFKFLLIERIKKIYGYSVLTDYFSNSNEYKSVGRILHVNCFNEFKRED